MSADAEHERKANGRATKDSLGWSIPDVGALGLLFVVVLGWVAVELFAPALLVAAYAVLVGALRRVAHDTHSCEGNLVRSIVWGAVWATLYTSRRRRPAAALITGTRRRARA